MCPLLPVSSWGGKKLNMSQGVKHSRRKQPEQTRRDAGRQKSRHRMPLLGMAWLHLSPSPAWGAHRPPCSLLQELPLASPHHPPRAGGAPWAQHCTVEVAGATGQQGAGKPAGHPRGWKLRPSQEVGTSALPSPKHGGHRREGRVTSQASAGVGRDSTEQEMLSHRSHASRPYT